MAAKITQRTSPPELTRIADAERSRGAPFPEQYAAFLNAPEGSAVEANRFSVPGGDASQVHLIIPAGMLEMRITALEQRLGPGFLPVALAAGGEILMSTDDGSIHFYEFRSSDPTAHLAKVADSIPDFLERLVPDPVAAAPGCWW